MKMSKFPKNIFNFRRVMESASDFNHKLMLTNKLLERGEGLFTDEEKETIIYIIDNSNKPTGTRIYKLYDKLLDKIHEKET
jgi:hypothetical protein